MTEHSQPDAGRRRPREDPGHRGGQEYLIEHWAFLFDHPEVPLPVLVSSIVYLDSEIVDAVPD